MRMKYFLRSVKSFTEFPLEYLNGLRELVHNISQHEHEMPFPTSLLLCLGVLPIPGAHDSYLILSWSELDRIHMSTRRINGSAVLSRVIAYVSGVIRTATQAIGQRARELWVDSKELLKCESCVFRGMFMSRVLFVYSCIIFTENSILESPEYDTNPWLQLLASNSFEDPISKYCAGKQSRNKSRGIEMRLTTAEQ